MVGACVDCEQRAASQERRIRQVHVRQNKDHDDQAHQGDEQNRGERAQTEPSHSS